MLDSLHLFFLHQGSYIILDILLDVHRNKSLNVSLPIV
jgi:hypothetical protein